MPDESNTPFDDATHWVGKLPPSKQEEDKDEDTKKTNIGFCITALH